MYRLGNLPWRKVGGQPVREVLEHSPAGTGKTVGNQIQMLRWCRKYKDFRILVLRESLTRRRWTT
jgi:hypothetical protein